MTDDEPRERRLPPLEGDGGPRALEDDAMLLAEVEARQRMATDARRTMDHVGRELHKLRAVVDDVSDGLSSMLVMYDQTVRRTDELEKFDAVLVERLRRLLQAKGVGQ